MAGRKLDRARKHQAAAYSLRAKPHSLTSWFVQARNMRVKAQWMLSHGTGQNDLGGQSQRIGITCKLRERTEHAATCLEVRCSNMTVVLVKRNLADRLRAGELLRIGRHCYEVFFGMQQK